MKRTTLLELLDKARQLTLTRTPENNVLHTQRIAMIQVALMKDGGPTWCDDADDNYVRWAKTGDEKSKQSIVELLAE